MQTSIQELRHERNEKKTVQNATKRQIQNVSLVAFQKLNHQMQDIQQNNIPFSALIKKQLIKEEVNKKNNDSNQFQMNKGHVFPLMIVKQVQVIIQASNQTKIKQLQVANQDAQQDQKSTSDRIKEKQKRVQSLLKKKREIMKDSQQLNATVRDKINQILAKRKVEEKQSNIKQRKEKPIKNINGSILDMVKNLYSRGCSSLKKLWSSSCSEKQIGFTIQEKDPLIQGQYIHNSSVSSRQQTASNMRLVNERDDENNSP